jgi:Tol biopolymer transport system component
VVQESASRIVYAADGRIHVMNGDGSRSRALASGRSPSWSPNGASIVFESARIPGNGLDIYVMDADGTDQRRLVNHPGGGGEHPVNTADDFAPAWSPSGWAIAFTTNRDGNDEIYTMDPIGHSVQRRTNMPSSERDPAWSPDGEIVAFVSDRDGNDDVFALDRRQNLVPLTRDAAPDRSPAWSPDGRRIAFQSFRDGNWEIYVMDADGRDQRRVTNSPAGDTNPSRSPDGQTIAFTSSDGGAPYLAAMSPSGGPARR